jgi:hypothetical protein
MPRNSSVRERSVRNSSLAEPSRVTAIRCAIYTRKSIEEGASVNSNWPTLML